MARQSPESSSRPPPNKRWYPEKAEEMDEANRKRKVTYRSLASTEGVSFQRIGYLIKEHRRKKALADIVDESPKEEISLAPEEESALGFATKEELEESAQTIGVHPHFARRLWHRSTALEGLRTEDGRINLEKLAGSIISGELQELPELGPQVINLAESLVISKAQSLESPEQSSMG